MSCQLLNKKIGWQLTNNKVLFLSLKRGLVTVRFRRTPNGVFQNRSGVFLGFFKQPLLSLFFCLFVYLFSGVLEQEEEEQQHKKRMVRSRGESMVQKSRLSLLPKHSVFQKNSRRDGCSLEEPQDKNPKNGSFR